MGPERDNSKIDYYAFATMVDQLNSDCPVSIVETLTIRNWSTGTPAGLAFGDIPLEADRLAVAGASKSPRMDSPPVYKARS